ncbi:unnamed protein product [Leptosia nina]|uniref:Uncharacterized protein n=1 Tax=Leptosia nina TaxID=320188 RepID=A0AAV1JZV5_9NEOP
MADRTLACDPRPSANGILFDRRHIPGQEHVAYVVKTGNEAGERHEQIVKQVEATEVPQLAHKSLEVDHLPTACVDCPRAMSAHYKSANWRREPPAGPVVREIGSINERLPKWLCHPNNVAIVALRLDLLTMI